MLLFYKNINLIMIPRNEDMIRIYKNVFLMAMLAFNFNAFSNVEYVDKPNVKTDHGYADIVEPLIPSVVNVYTSKNVSKNKSRDNKIEKNRSSRLYEFDLDDFDDLENFMKDFGFPFHNFDELYSNPKSVSLGSGFIIDSEGYIVTNYHVVKNADEINVKLDGGSEISAKVIGTDQRTDIALLKIETKIPLKYAKFGNSDLARVGDRVFTIGNPFGLNSTVTTGIISSKSRDIDISNNNVADYIQTDASINRGNSGGPMFNINGEVIGVNTAIYSPSGGSVGIGFSIPSNTVKNVVEQLKSQGKVTRSLLNITIQDMNNEIAEGLGLESAKGVLVVDVDPNGPGGRAGLKSGDIVVSFNDNEVKNSKKLQNLVGDSKVNSEAKISIIRSGKKMDLKAVLTEYKENENKTASVNLDDQKNNAIKIGGASFIEQDLTEKDKNKSVVVSKIDDSSWGALTKGDLVLSIGNTTVQNLKNLENLYADSKKANKKNIVLHVKRGKANVFIALPIL